MVDRDVDVEFVPTIAVSGDVDEICNTALIRTLHHER